MELSAIIELNSLKFPSFVNASEYKLAVAISRSIKFIQFTVNTIQTHRPVNIVSAMKCVKELNMCFTREYIMLILA